MGNIIFIGDVFMYIFDQGKFIHESEFSISVRNKGLNYGMGCFDGIRAFWNEDQQQLYVFRLPDHLQRLHHSGESINLIIPFTQMQLFHFTIRLLIMNNVREDMYIRPICIDAENSLHPDAVNSSTRLMIYLVSLKSYISAPTIKVSVSSWTRIGNNIIPPQTKSTAGYLNSSLASTEAKLNGFDEAIFLTKDGNVCEGPGENIFIVKNQQLITPPISDDILAGITRNTVMHIATQELRLPILERSLARTELYSADEVFFTGTAIGIKPIVNIDRRMIGNGSEGAVTQQIRLRYDQIVRGNNPQYLGYCTSVY